MAPLLDCMEILETGNTKQNWKNKTQNNNIAIIFIGFDKFDSKLKWLPL
jgi:hypothetical protein